MLSTQKIKGYDIIPPKKSAFMIPTSENMIKLHCLLVASGKRGGGKSVAVSNLIKKMLDEGSMDRILIITPTYNSNKEIWEHLNIDEDDVFEIPDKKAISDIMTIIDKEREEWDEFEKNLKAYEAFQRFQKTKKHIDDFDADDLLRLFNNNYLLKRPEWKRGKENEHMPRLGLIVDDCLGTKLFNPSSGFLNLNIKHRHVGNGMGISIFMMVQSYCSQNGLPRVVRENCTSLLLFKNKDENQIKKICEEIGSDVNVEKFLELFKDATEAPHSFLFIDFNPKNKDKMFRKCFNEYYVIDKVKD